MKAVIDYDKVKDEYGEELVTLFSSKSKQSAAHRRTVADAAQGRLSAVISDKAVCLHALENLSMLLGQVHGCAELSSEGGKQASLR